jgi:hypothetical protein
MAYDFDIDYSLRVAVDKGTTLSRTGTVEVGAIDVVRGTAAKSGGEASFDVQPEAITGIEFVCIESSNYANLTLEVDGGAAITVDGPIMLIGAGAVAMLQATQNYFVFTNADTVSNANIRVTIGRSGVYTPPE